MVSAFPQVARLGEMALNLLFPRWCVGCGKEGELICTSCRSRLPRIFGPLCPRCGRPQPNGILCPSCVSWQAHVDGIRSPFRFEGVIRDAVHQLKYKNIRALASPLTQLLNDYLAANPLPGDVLIPVPLHQRRLRERGYNQSSLLARELGKLARLPIADDCLIRERFALPQARTATVEERLRNVADAFSCHDTGLKGKQVLLIDDVATSGATLDACAGALKAAGAGAVWGLTLAREI